MDRDSTLDYMIRFENDQEKATAPAAVVRVTEQLDADLDWTTFRFGSMGFGDTVLSGAAGKTSYQARLDLIDRFGIFLEVSAGLDLQTDEVFWELRSIDPETGEVPFNPFLGFLPPNKNGSEGQGYVTYLIKPKAQVASGTVIDAVATIIFDQNEPIDTLPIFNTLDGGMPNKSFGELQDQSYLGMLVSWSGEDDQGGSGIAEYDICVAEDDGPFSLWLQGTTLTEAPFYAVTPGHTYAFLSVASDLVGHREEAPETADAVTTALASPSVQRVDVPLGPVRSLSIVFSEAMGLADAVADGSISESVLLTDAADHILNLEGLAFAYDDTTWTLTMSWNQPLEEGNYRLRFGLGGFSNTAGGSLAGGWDGISFHVQQFVDSGTLQAVGSEIQVTAYSVPSLVDWDGDGLLDLIVGEKASDQEGKIRIYRNQGTDEFPVYESYTYAQSLTGDLVVPAGDGLGAFPRLADWNGDGESDLLIGLADGRVQLWINVNSTADPVFALPNYVQVGQPGAKRDIDVGEQATVDLSDWNGDGRLDLVLGANDGTIHVLLDEAASGVADFRTDSVIQLGTSDLLTVEPAAEAQVAATQTSGCGCGVSTCMPQQAAAAAAATATGSPLLVPSGGSSVVLADLNADGLNDLIVGNTEGQLLFHPNVGADGAPLFVASWLLSVDARPIDLEGQARSRPWVGDANDDGIPDVLLGAEYGPVRLFAGLSEQVVLAPDQSEQAFVSAGEYWYSFAVTSGTDTPWQNPADRYDINNDGLLTPSDALELINYLNVNGTTTLPVPPPSQGGPPPFLDVTGDNMVTPHDVLWVVNKLNRESLDSFASGEAESALPFVRSQEIPSDMAQGGMAKSTAWSAVSEISPDTKSRSASKRLANPTRNDFADIDELFEAMGTEGLVAIDPAWCWGEPIAEIELPFDC